MNSDIQKNKVDLKDFEEGSGENFAKVSPEENQVAPENANKNSRKRSRIWEIDFLRGVCVLLMVWDHIMYDFGYLFGNYGGIWYGSEKYAGSAAERIAWRAVEYWNSPLRAAVWPIVVSIFVILAGISSGLSRSNLKRGVKLAIFAALLTLVTSILNTFISGTTIKFGVLHMLSVSMILIGLVELALKYLKADEKFKYTSIIVYTVIGVTLFLIGRPYYFNFSSGSGLTQYIVYTNGVISADYFPVLPWAGLMFLGAVLGKLVYKDRKGLTGKANDKLLKYTAPVNYVGRIAVWIYLLHQVIVFALLLLFGMIAGYGGI